jgi:hypothetical protein
MNKLKSITFIKSSPVKLSDLFNIPKDNSSWNYNYCRIKNENYVPDREKIFTPRQILIPKNKDIKEKFSKKSHTNYGIYILLFKTFSYFYIGIAAKYSGLDKNGNIKKIKTPEGIFTRLKKHRAKCTATHVSNNYNHTGNDDYGWKSFAKKRYKHYSSEKQIDTMDDCYLATLIFENHDSYKDNDKGKLKELENHLNNPKPLSDLFGKKYLNYKPLAKTGNDILSYQPNII